MSETVFNPSSPLWTDADLMAAADFSAAQRAKSREVLMIFLGYDSREQDAYDVCEASLLCHASQPLHIVKLDVAALRAAGFYRREWHQDGKDRIDASDGRPFSTDFAFTRFFVPALSLYQGWALFCDCDFLFTADIVELFDHADDRYAAMCVKREHVPIETVKMAGASQAAYERKNWSSLTLWNCGHPANSFLTSRAVNELAGRDLHAFRWLKDEQIGSIPQRWNWLAGVDEALGITPSGVHFTLGVPSMPGHENTPYADLWHSARDALTATRIAA